MQKALHSPGVAPGDKITEPHLGLGLVFKRPGQSQLSMGWYLCENPPGVSMFKRVVSWDLAERNH